MKPEHRCKMPVSPWKAKNLHYPDVQKYFKRIRKANFKFRYVVAGEYGDQKGRAHWHILVFWEGLRPERFAWKDEAWRKSHPNYDPLYGNEWQDRFWHHGHVNYREFDEKKARYVCKYLRKSEFEKEPNRQIAFHYSSRPGIGFKWLVTYWAQRHIDQGLAPQKPLFSFPDSIKKGKRVQYYMTPHAQIKFAQAYERMWYEQKGDHPPSSPFLDKINDLLARPLVSDKLEKRECRKPPDMPLPGFDVQNRYVEQPDGSFKDTWPRVHLDERRNAYWSEYAFLPGLRFYWSFDEKGHRSWQRDVVTEREASTRQRSSAAEAYSNASAARLTSPV